MAPAVPGDAASQAEAALRDARIAELATGFALGELDEAELRELYEALRSEAVGGAGAARVAWEALGTVMDLRAGMSRAFQDELTHKLGHGAGSAGSSRHTASGGFATDLWRRLGFARPGLAPVDAPPAKPAERIKLRWVIVAVVLGVVALALAAQGAFERASVARVARLDGAAQLDGRALTVAAGVDRGLIAVPAGSRLVLAWSDGSQASLEGPAQAVAQTRGVSLPNGRATVTAIGAFALGLPDRERAIELAGGARAAVEIRGGRSLLALERGAAAYERGTLVAGRALAGRGGDFAWITANAPDGADGEQRDGLDAPSWRWSATLTPAEDGAIEVDVADGNGGVATLRLAPGAAEARQGDSVVQRLTLRGPPLKPLAIALSLDDGAVRAAIGGDELRLPAALPLARLAWRATGGARLERIAFHTGPAPSTAR